MAAVPAGGLTGGFSAWWRLVVLSSLRQCWSMQTLIALILFEIMAVLVTVRSFWGWQFVVFSKALIGGIYISFMLPILCLCFGTQSIGGDWEERSLVWLLTRPLPRPLIYLAKYVAAIPWTFGLTLGGLFLLGALAGEEGWQSAVAFWPAVAWGTAAYLSLFVLMGAWFRRSTVIAVLYSFVLETIVGNMPGLLKRASIGFYSRCVIYGSDYPNIAPDRENLFMPVAATTSVWVLATITVVLLLFGVFVFSRREYNDLT